MSVVAKEPPKSGKRGRGRPPSDEPLRNHIGVKLSDTLALALKAYKDAQKHEPNEPTIMRDALKFFLEAEGFWPPQS